MLMRLRREYTYNFVTHVKWKAKKKMKKHELKRQIVSEVTQYQRADWIFTGKDNVSPADSAFESLNCKQHIATSL